MYSPETEARLSALRAIAQERELTTEEQKEALTLIRQDRVSAAYASKNSKAAKVAVDPASVLEKLKGLMNKE